MNSLEELLDKYINKGDPGAKKAIDKIQSEVSWGIKSYNA